ncbi:hypothetical protein GTP77_11985 [Massilia sp. FT127W]|uniref:Malate dehydrogenase n=2 Tax=Pseudoduganella aquatica TaxID=2660641 RepID=A0A7X4KMD1_9BURK|nr:hypothetical protein [Pseudoduganella aquatica]
MDTPPLPASGQGNVEHLDFLRNLLLNFHQFAMQLRHRHGQRDPVTIEDEYDVQDLLHALLRLKFTDIRPEEYVPSYASKCSRTDFYLPALKTFIEVKKTRDTLRTKELSDQLIIDITRYRAHPGCSRLICFVYDPDGLIQNPAGIESDLNSDSDGFEVLVVIQPQR